MDCWKIWVLFGTFIGFIDESRSMRREPISGTYIVWIKKGTSEEQMKVHMQSTTDIFIKDGDAELGLLEPTDDAFQSMLDTLVDPNGVNADEETLENYEKDKDKMDKELQKELEYENKMNKYYRKKIEEENKKKWGVYKDKSYYNDKSKRSSSEEDDSYMTYSYRYPVYSVLRLTRSRYQYQNLYRSEVIETVCIVNGQKVYSYIISGADERLMNLYQDIPDIYMIEQEEKVTIEGGKEETCITQTNLEASWGLDIMNRRVDVTNEPFDDSYSVFSSATGRKVHVYVLDAGVHKFHSEFRRNDGKRRRIKRGINTITTSDFKEDTNGHGTAVAAIIGGRTLGVAKQTILHPVKVMDRNVRGEIVGTIGSVIRGIAFVLAMENEERKKERKVIVNMSLKTGFSRLLNAAVQELLDSGITVTAAAGNDAGDACEVSPASLDGVISVSAATRRDELHYSTNRGRCVDIAAPGEQIKSASILCNTCTGTFTGSSFATGFVTGAIAGYMSQQSNVISPEEAKRWIVNNAFKKNNLSFLRIAGCTPNKR
ncbi:unnamed protein product [Owenia fusiformis]|uniref:Peptidase S8/S53 domain-containing protein n=1 Tax=Owenia fusiformis TaxID=6347 RepID=A0A8J1Y191_OWEFU|nr:unnamed protein product [Owenia fusiformis]